MSIDAVSMFIIALLIFTDVELSRLNVVAVILDVVESKLSVVVSISIVGVLIVICPKFSESSGSLPTSISYVPVILD